MRHPSPLIQLTANSEDQVRNAYRPLVAMIRLGPLKQLLKVREGFIRILRPGINLDDDDLDLDRIDVVTASATSRLGNPISDAEQDEAGLYTQVERHARRGRHPTPRRRRHGRQNALLDQRLRPRRKFLCPTAIRDIGIGCVDLLPQPPTSTRTCATRTVRHTASTTGANAARSSNGCTPAAPGCPWIPSEAEAEALMEKDPAQAERFFGNRMVQGGGAWLEDGLWESCYAGQ